MTGQKIKEILKAEGFTLTDIAEKLGYDNDQRLHSALRSDDVKSGLIEEIARVTNKSIGFFYGMPVIKVNDHGLQDSPEGVYNETEISLRFIGLLEKKDEQLDRMLSLLEKK